MLRDPGLENQLGGCGNDPHEKPWRLRPWGWRGVVDSGSILKAEPIGFLDGSVVGHEKEEGDWSFRSF